MNEEPKSIWKRRFSPWRQWLIIVAATYVVIILIGYLSGNQPKEATDWWAPLIVAGIFATLICAVLLFIYWICHWRNLHRFLFWVACLATLIALFYAEEDLRGKWAWSHFKHTWEAKGEHLDLASLVPPPVPDDQNFALTPIMFSTYGSMIDKTGHEINPRNTNVVNRLELKIFRDNDLDRAPTNGNWAKGTLTDLAPWQMYYRTLPTNNARVTTNEFPTSPEPQPPARDVLLALSKNDSTVEELREASRMPYSRFPLEYDKEDPAMILLPHLAREKMSGQFLQLRAIAELRAGQIEQTAADIKLMCYLNQASKAEPFLISHLVRIAMLNYALQPIYEGCAEHKWSDAQLSAFDAELAEFDFLADYQRSMRCEAAFLTEEIGRIQRTRKVSPYLGMFSQGQQYGFPGMDFVCWLSPSGWFRQNQIRFSEFYLQHCLPVVNMKEREVSPKAAEEAQASLNAATTHPTPYNALQYVFYMPVKQWLFEKYAAGDKFAHGQASVDLARVAIALERYRLAHGDYPESLDVLASQFIQKLPHDIIGGQPLKYRQTNDSFVLYSVGWNEKDDGGIAVLTRSGSLRDESGRSGMPDTEKGDWVWAYPAK